MRSIQDWVQPRLARAAELANQQAASDAAESGPLLLGIDLGTSDIVTMVLDSQAMPVAVRLDWTDVVRDGIVWDFFGAVSIVRRQYSELSAILGERLPSSTTTSFPPGTDPRISLNVIEAAGLEVSGVIDEPSAVASLLQLDRAGVVDIGGGTTGVAIIQDGKIVYSADEPTGGHHVSLTLAGSRNMPLDKAETIKKSKENADVWPIVRPVFDKMAHIVADHIKGHDVETLYLSGGSCSMPGVQKLFEQVFPGLKVILPQPPIFLTPLSITAYGLLNGGIQES